MNIKALEADFRGDILTPGSAKYESSRRIWNSMIDRRPAIIARCSGPADVRAAVRFCVDQDIYPAIRGGGHNAAGPAMVDGGLVLDLSRMKGIFINPQTPRRPRRRASRGVNLTARPIWTGSQPLAG